MQFLSKITSQGQVSVPAAVRQVLGLGPGSTLAWVQDEGRISVQRASRHSTDEVHQALFPQGLGASSAPKALDDLKEGLRQHMRRRHAGR